MTPTAYPWPEPLSAQVQDQIDAAWILDPSVTYLNHGSFSACPRVLLDTQTALRERLEREPGRFFSNDLAGLLDDARFAVAEYLHADPECLAFVPNATTGVNAVLRSLTLQPGDELLTTNHDYTACRNALHFVAERSGARVVVADIPFPLSDPGQVVEAVLNAVTDRTRLALLDHITSPTALVLPIEALIPALHARGIETLIDGAHAIGMLPVDLGALADLGATYYTTNCHKWLCTPRGSAVLWVREEAREKIRPVTISHGTSLPRANRSRFRLEFDWTGTDDPTAYLCAAAAIDVIGAMLPGGWPQIRARNRAMALAARQLVCETFGLTPPAPASMIGSMVAIALPPAEPDPDATYVFADPAQRILWEEHRIDVPIFSWPQPPFRILRLSAQLYNRPAQYERLVAELAPLLES